MNSKAGYPTNEDAARCIDVALKALDAKDWGKASISRCVYIYF
jgi:hypothetical protein